MSFPEIQPGGSLIVAWQVKDKHVLVVGGGEVRLQTTHHDPKDALILTVHTARSPPAASCTPSTPMPESPSSAQPPA
jgi:hypothetical protein